MNKTKIIKFCQTEIEKLKLETKTLYVEGKIDGYKMIIGAVDFFSEADEKILVHMLKHAIRTHFYHLFLLRNFKIRKGIKGNIYACRNALIVIENALW